MTEFFCRLGALIKKEFLSILRDPKSRIIIIAPPLIQLALFANILTMETKNAVVLAVDRSQTLESREFIAGIGASSWFGGVKAAADEQQARQALAKEKAQAALFIPQGGQLIPQPRGPLFHDAQCVHVMPHSEAV